MHGRTCGEALDTRRAVVPCARLPLQLNGSPVGEAGDHGDVYLSAGESASELVDMFSIIGGL